MMKTYLLVCLLMLVAVFCLQASDLKIELNKQQELLIAPEGTDYIWFHNGEMINVDACQEITIEKSGRYAVSYLDEHQEAQFLEVQIEKTKDGIRRIFIIGDSTVMTYSGSKYPMSGWGQVLGLYFDAAKIEIQNRAIGGRSSRSFHEENRWTSVKGELQEGDFVFIQFGHNDRDWTKAERYTDTTQYKEYLRIYVNESRALGATPVLISPMVMNAWNGTEMRNVFTEGSNDYRGAMYRVSKELNVVFVDLNMRSYAFFSELGAEYSAKYFFLGLNPGEYSNYPDGSNDGTHFQEMGALTMSRIITTELAKIEGEDNIAYLNAAMLPTYQLNVELKPSHAGIATLSEQYPAGANITLKGTMNPQYTFSRWLDASESTYSDQVLATATMPEADVTYTLAAFDCLGAEMGEAYFDACNNCLKNINETPPCNSAIQTERACGYTGEVLTEDAGDYVVEYIRLKKDTAGVVHFPVFTFEEASENIGVKHANGASGQLIDIYVNGKIQVEDAVFPETDEVWQVTNFELNLAKGKNTVSVVFSYVIDEIDVDMLVAYTDNVVRGLECIDLDFIGVLSTEKNSEMMVYPNPFISTATITAKSRFQYEIATLEGKVINTGECEGECEVGSSLKSGYYIMKVLGNSSSTSLLMIKK